jgi:hypothetical protein
MVLPGSCVFTNLWYFMFLFNAPTWKQVLDEQWIFDKQIDFDR